MHNRTIIATLVVLLGLPSTAVAHHDPGHDRGSPQQGNDADGDGIKDRHDNCPHAANPDQTDRDGDGTGDACDDPGPVDSDGDGVADDVDNCPDDANPDQADTDGDGTGDACDPDLPSLSDVDGDGVSNLADNCPVVSNPGQHNADGDWMGDACDPRPYGYEGPPTMFDVLCLVFPNSRPCGEYPSRFP